MTYLISYDLNKPGKDYAGVHKAIKDSSTGIWCKPLESLYIIRSTLTTKAIYERIKPHFDTGDRILVIEVTSTSHWYLDHDVADYLNEML